MQPSNTYEPSWSETPYLRMEMLSTGILIAEYKRGTKIDLPTAKEIVASRVAFTGERTVPVLLYIEGLLSIHRNARKYISSIEGVKYLSAAAIMKDSAFAAVVGNLFSSLNNPIKIPVRIFTNRQKAMTWLAEKHREWEINTNKDATG